MDEGFNKFKKRVLKEHLIKCLILGVCLSAIINALLFVMLKRIPFDLHFVIYLLFFAILSFGLTYLFYKTRMPSDLKIAKRLDKTFLLNEKVQTMVKFEDKDNKILKLQKLDTENNLKNIPIKKLPVKISALNFGLILLTLIFVSTSFFVPAKAKNPSSQSNNSSSDSNSFVSTDSFNTNSEGTTSGDNQSGDGEGDSQSQDYQDQLDAIRDLINQSDAENQVKQDMHQAIDDLEAKLDNAKTEDEAKDAIQETIDKVQQIVDEANSSIEKIANALKQEKNINLIALGDVLLAKDIDDAINTAIDSLNNELKNYKDQELIDNLKDIAQQIKDALINSQVSEDDALYQALNTFANSLEEIANSLDTKLIDEDRGQERIDRAINQLKEDILNALTLKNNNQNLADQVIDVLNEMLNPSDENDGDPSDGEGNQEDEENKDDEGEANPNEGEEDDENDPNVDSDGETIYGSDDTIYTDEGYGKYGDVLDNYYGKIVDENNAETDEDLGNILDDYFASLYR